MILIRKKCKVVYKLSKFKIFGLFRLQKCKFDKKDLTNRFFYI